MNERKEEKGVRKDRRNEDSERLEGVGKEGRKVEWKKLMEG